ncbi:alpha-glycosidase [Marinilactibacillus psychrotolerans]|uniref:Alpha-glycosidase n=1 Tax=Marinilactibacillus psychrotolerans TaxID=191770 RepID=A0A5R9BVR4_9LACT|nr:glycoside hydrolase family 13 protein [Marinilactibacillus psychrotolerans]TLQ04717.1 alpha-glycosidase [Marinilactibacillus psychrotolerans]
MNTAALYHRTESEHAYLYEKDHFHIRLRTQAGDVAQVELLSGDPYTIEGDKWYENGKEMRKIASTNLHDYWLIDTHEQTNRMSYGFHVTGRDGIEVFYSDQGVYPYDEAFLQEASFYFRIPYIHEIDAFKAPEWVKNTIWYQVFPDRFENGDASIDPEGTLPWGDKENPSRDDFYGGDLRGLINRLDYLEDLGINGIYLCPIFKASSNHKYDTIDYYEVDPGFGDKETFKELVDKAHERGIKIMLDAVFNHLGWHSPQWQDVLKHQEASKYKDWFYIHSFPVDNLGEIWHSSQKWLNGDEFHAVMNYAFNDNIENYFLKKIITPSRMVSGLNAQMMLYRQQTSEVMFNLLDSHDTSRLLTKAKGDKELVKSALAFMFAQKGTPCIFYGTEIGLYGEMDPDCRKCMIWDEELQDQEMLGFTRDLIGFRKYYQKILTYGEIEWHDVRDDEQLIGFKRTLGNESLIFYFNQDKDDAFLDMLPSEAVLSLETATVHYDNQAVLHENGFVVYYHVDTEAEKRMRTEQKRQRTKERMKRMKVLPSHLVRN